VALLVFGTLLADALQAGEALNATVIDMRFVKPLDADLIGQLAARHSLLVTVEENVLMGGAGSAVGELLATRHLHLSLLSLGLPDGFIEQGSQAQMRDECGLNAHGIEQAIRQRLQIA